MSQQGERVDRKVVDEREHFIQCESCGGWIDCRNLSEVFEHEGPHEKPAQQ